MAVDEGGDVGGVGGLADLVGDVDGEEVAGGGVAGEGGAVDVVGVEEVGLPPGELVDGGVGGSRQTTEPLPR